MQHDHPNYEVAGLALEYMGYEFLGEHTSGYREYERTEPRYHVVAIPSGLYTSADDLSRSLVEQGVGLPELAHALVAVNQQLKERFSAQ